ncbi:hypothetical protein LBMAG53_09250 [Planctomycetota bacterium]|nr:hypothetical protein LBMAG53_09250 [Planctomycetota bacterium]
MATNLLRSVFLSFAFGLAVAAEPVPSGLAVQIGQPAAAAAALARSGAFLVRRYVPAAQVAAERQSWLSAGLADRISVAPLPADGRLAEPDRFADLVVADGSIGEPELIRIANVEAQLVINGAPPKVRPPEAGLGTWASKWADETGNGTTPDTKVGPTTAVQWVAGPFFADGTSVKHPRIAQGAHACLDNASGTLVVRSAGNGLIRWRSAQALPELADLSLHDSRVYLRIPPADSSSREFGPLHALDLATGADLVTYGEGPAITAMAKGDRYFPTDLVVGGTIVMQVGQELAAVDRASGSRRWTVAAPNGLVWFGTAVDVAAGAVVAVQADRTSGGTRGRIDNTQTPKYVVVLDLATGAQRWRNPVEWSPNAEDIGESYHLCLRNLTVGQNSVLLYASSYQTHVRGAFVEVLDLATGARRWRHPLNDNLPGKWASTDSACKIFLRPGEAWFVGGHGASGWTVWDLASGAEKRPFTKRVNYTYGGYGGACSGPRATSQWIIMCSTTFVPVDGGAPVHRPAVRSGCGSGNFPAQGMVFANPGGCDCSDYLRGYVGMACTTPPALPEAGRLDPGVETPLGPADPTDGWPIFCGTPQRTNATAQRLADRLAVQWTVKPAPTAVPGLVANDRALSEYWSGPLTAPTAVGDRVVVALGDAGAVAGLDAPSGKVLWTTPLDGAIDAPPTLYRGLAIVGTAAGTIHALRLNDGQRVWTFDAAPARQTAVAFGRISSAYPAVGSVLVLDGKVFATTGWHAQLGGIAGWVLDAATGKALANGRYQDGPSGNVALASNDLLVADAAGTAGFLSWGMKMQADGSMTFNQKSKEASDPERIIFDRRSSLVRFCHIGRGKVRTGGSTHNWNRPVRRGPINGLRLAVAGNRIYTSYEGVILAAASTKPRPDKPDLLIPEPLWQKTAAELKFTMVNSAPGGLVVAGERLYLGGGDRTGAGPGWLLVCAASDGAELQRLELPAMVVPNGLAVSGRMLYATCLDGSVVAIGKAP